jgi:proteasome lid subunit RPN8/RPN11
MFQWRRRSRKQEAAPPPVNWVSAQLLDRTADVLRQSGDRGQLHEGVVYWAGRRMGAQNIVTTCIAPDARTTYGSFATTSHANARVVMYLADHGLELLGQVHSHPGAFVDHSDGDDECALMPYDGFLSIVVPRYARDGLRPLSSCGVHIFEFSGFRRLSHAEIAARFRIIDDFADLRL